MRVISYSSKTLADRRCQLIKQSVDKFNIPLEVFTIADFDWEGKVASGHARRWLETVPDDEIILATDLFDVIFLTYIKEIEDKFLRINKPIVFSAEADPPGDYSFGPWTPGPTRWNAVNGGNIVAYAAALKELVSYWPDKAQHNQSAWRYYLQDNESICHLDRQCDIFQCIYDHRSDGRPFIDDILAVNNGRIHNMETGTTPCIMHGHGRQEARLSMWCQRMNDHVSRQRQLRFDRHAILKTSHNIP